MTVTDDQSPKPNNWREAIDTDPLGLVTHKQWEPAGGESAPAEPSKQGGVLRLLLGVVAIIAIGYAAHVGETVLIVLFLVLSVVAHEFGHFIAAKTGRVKVTEFFVGFGPRLWSVKRGETEYGVKGLPLGGYCRIVGMNNLEEVEPADEERTYRRAPFYRRMLIDLAGPATNIAIGIVVLFAMFFWTGDNGNFLSTPADTRIVVSTQVVSGKSPAQVAGLQTGDRIEAIDGQRATSYSSMTDEIQASAGKTLVLTVQRDGKTITLRATPVAIDKLHLNQGEATLATGNEGFLGISPDPVIHSSFTASVGHAASASWSVVTRSVHALGHLVSPTGATNYVHMLSNQKAADSSTSRFSSPIKVVQVFNEAASAGIGDVLWIFGLVQVSIGFINLLPLFPFDGGRVVINLYEGVRSIRRRGYRVDMQKLLPVLYAGLAIFAFLGLSAIFLDLRDVVS